ncbi:HU family DNA-binding protein (plasmid) [Paenibacillus sp. S-38]|uniref:HU family DNA-binding protein n=1 Tax=Paenibacillus sp. S-38 TaxID=3416710 RepID=UPI003CED1283
MQVHVQTAHAEVFKDDIARVYAQQRGISNDEAKERITDILEIITAYLVNGYNVKLHRFFNFKTRILNAKSANVPSTGAPMTIPRTRTVIATMTRSLKSRIQGKQ